MLVGVGVLIAERCSTGPVRVVTAAVVLQSTAAYRLPGRRRIQRRSAGQRSALVVQVD